MSDICTAVVYIAVIVAIVRIFCGPLVVIVKEKEKEK